MATFQRVCIHRLGSIPCPAGDVCLLIVPAMVHGSPETRKDCFPIPEGRPHSTVLVKRYHVRAFLDFQAQCVQGTLCQAGLKQAEKGVREKEFGLGVRLSWCRLLHS